MAPPDLAEPGRCQVRGADRGVMELPDRLSRSASEHTILEWRFFGPGEHTYGHTWKRRSLGLVDPDTGVSIGYAMNRLWWGPAAQTPRWEPIFRGTLRQASETLLPGTQPGKSRRAEVTTKARASRILSRRIRTKLVAPTEGVLLALLRSQCHASLPASSSTCRTVKLCAAFAAASRNPAIRRHGPAAEERPSLADDHGVVMSGLRKSRLLRWLSPWTGA